MMVFVKIDFNPDDKEFIQWIRDSIPYLRETAQSSFNPDKDVILVELMTLTHGIYTGVSAHNKPAITKEELCALVLISDSSARLMYIRSCLDDRKTKLITEF